MGNLMRGRLWSWRRLQLAPFSLANPDQVTVFMNWLASIIR
jgi:hypothetical protein